MTDALSVRGPVLLGLAALVALVGGFGLWSTQARLASAIVSRGQIVVADDRQTVQHPDGGVVTAVHVREGDRVARGALLLRLDGRALQSDLRKVEERLSELAARSARLVAERDGAAAPVFPADLQEAAAISPEVAAQIDGQQRLFAARRATVEDTRRQLERRIAQLQAQRDGIDAQRLALLAELDLLSQELATRQALRDKGLAPETAVLALRREKAGVTGRIAEAAAAIARTEEQVTEVGLQISALFTRRREEAMAELRDIGPAMLELSETRRALLDRIARLELRAPINGVVLGLQATENTVLRPAEAILTLVPQDGPLALTTRLDPDQIDAIRPGQPAEVVLLSLDAADRPRLAASVTRVSADVLADRQTGSAYFEVRLTLDPGEVARLGKAALLPGMPVEVYLLTGSQTPLAYLLQPFTAYVSRAMREG